MKRVGFLLLLCITSVFCLISQNIMFASESVSDIKNIDLFDDISKIFVKEDKSPSINQVVLGGIPIGISLQNDYVEIVGFSQIISDCGAISPATLSGLCVGDKIVEIDNEKIYSKLQVQNIAKEGNSSKILIIRDGKEKKLEIRPQKDVLTGEYKFGMWIKDTSNGVGTLTFVTKNNNFGSLGHPVANSNGEIVSIKGGNVHNCSVLGVNKGQVGKAGALKGTFNALDCIGKISSNNKFGIFGKFNQIPKALDINNIVEVASRDEIKPGKALVYSTIEGNSPQYYEIEIIKVKNQKNEDKGLVIKVVDKELIKKTGGIVQGMSGSPILQNGKIVGAVTHVFINDPLRGYGVTIHNMLDCIN